ncbi:MAG TPA: aminotransferase class V-fold PLP-dependent enzyme [Firmicutes bacterium]|nr:aminotransferase class V-fold PLP-dependent enzyme [Bacillota bacterium]
MPENKIIYLDNAATSFPKPREVLEQMIETYARLGVSPGRGSYDLAVEAAELVFKTRQKLARFFKAPNPERVIFSANATDALNTAIQGLLGPGDHVVSTRLEHNSVLRPLFHLRERYGIEYDLVRFDGQGQVDPDEVAKAFKPNTRLVILCHASNVLGSVQQVPQIARVCAKRQIPLLLDVAQSAGHIPIDMSSWHIQGIAFTGHKALLAPGGIGGLVLSPELNVASTRFGGTGIESSSPVHTQDFPYRLEAGTLNLTGIFGLSAGIDYLEKEEAPEDSRLREMGLIRRLYDGLRSLPGIAIHSPPPAVQSVPVLTCSVKGVASADVGDILDGDFQIAARTGLHCAPLVHETLGTAAAGAVRFSPGRFNTEQDIDRAVEAMAAIAGRFR